MNTIRQYKSPKLYFRAEVALSYLRFYCAKVDNIFAQLLH